ncbi:unnamed protein product [Clonostachys solani]|uniref:Uncharacterized protein n=1 Tax=Clonostachys solani TaxID=160281 RepID=A0A9P0EPH1_9HYPO|nr:unnamed protein product [Clonostachys solani]
MLICYFQNELSTWFDYCDQSRHFANQVVQAASKHRIIFYAITAVSARHLAILKKWDPLAADHYQAKCLQHFIPALANRDPALGGDFLCAVTLILRLYDEMTVPAGESPSGHVLDTGILIRSQNPEAKGYSLCQASLFVAIRQEIFICFKARKVPPPLSQYLDDGSRTIDPADDFTWTRRIVAHTEDVLTFAYGSQSRSKERWAELKAYLDSWDQHRPSSFDAIWSSGDGEGGFPEMWFANDCHVSGQQYSDICHILLAVHDPHIPILGLDRLAACVSVDHLIRKLVRRICGIVLCDRRYLPAATVAGMAIAMCGDRFTDRGEQEKLLGILQGAEAHMTWSFLIAEDRLRSIWGI